ncbi:MAG TPA: hypothetical protein VEB21_02545 [Terriglobales bacterium]|nr:hypothetical protein [Terriglobales bacterium]
MRLITSIIAGAATAAAPRFGLARRCSPSRLSRQAQWDSVPSFTPIVAAYCFAVSPLRRHPTTRLTHSSCLDAMTHLLAVDHAANLSHPPDAICRTDTDDDEDD